MLTKLLAWDAFRLDWLEDDPFKQLSHRRIFYGASATRQLS